MITPVIMAGGTGSRLWPMSRELYPKQFLKLCGSNSMLQETIVRLEGLAVSDPVLICNEQHRFLAAEQLRQIDCLSGDIILEPVGRNTAPAIALAALQAISGGKDALLLILAADHIIDDVSSFHIAVNKAIPHAKNGRLVTFGIVPSGPETGYGYIQRGSTIQNQEQAYKVQRFVEKPDLKTANDYVISGEYYWNSGMFLFSAKKYLEELAKYRPDILNACEEAFSVVEKDSMQDFIRIDAEKFKLCPDESIDYAVMEKTEEAVVIPLDAGWNDVGSWSALWDVNSKNNDNNALIGDVFTYNAKDCYI
ncbi:mannose-1-phosphate guanylyltransferase/mannose-6-phosphate isomerase, partial [Klebsiella michiganensis]